MSGAVHPAGAQAGQDRGAWRFVDWIWNVRGSLVLSPGQSSDEAFGRLAPLFRVTGTSHDRRGDTLVFRKRDQAAQDKMSVFDGGTLRIESGAAGPVLRYHLTSRALLACFLAPLLFLAFAQLTVALGIFEAASAETAPKKPEKKEKEAAPRQHWIDQALGAPAPERPKKDKAKEEEDKKPSPTPAYVFAGLFAALYVAGRILEDRLIRKQFRQRLHGA